MSTERYARREKSQKRGHVGDSGTSPNDNEGTGHNEDVDECVRLSCTRRDGI